MSKKINRNDPCPCGSGKKYKHCCIKNEVVKTYTPAGKRKFKAKVLSSTANNLLGRMTTNASTEREFKATAGGLKKGKEEFEETTASFEQTTVEKIDVSEPLKTARFKKIPTKKPGDDFNPTDLDFRVDEK